MNKVYISGKISGLDLEEAKNKFETAENALKSSGYEVVNPMKLPHNHDKKWESYMKECIKALMDCTHFYVIPENLFSSRGAIIEIQLCIDLGLKQIDL
jgi:hypothetical protein